MRARGDVTPFFVYSTSDISEYGREVRERGGQGCTNDPQELFDQVVAQMSVSNAGLTFVEPT
jgi:hypothetical protein